MFGPGTSLFTAHAGPGPGAADPGGGRPRRYLSPLTIVAVAVLVVMLAVLLYALLRPEVTQAAAVAVAVCLPRRRAVA